MTINSWGTLDPKPYFNWLPRLKSLKLEIAKYQVYADLGSLITLEELVVTTYNDGSYSCGLNHLAKLKFLDLFAVETAPGLHKDARLQIFNASYLTRETMDFLPKYKNFEQCIVALKTSEVLLTRCHWLLTNNLVKLVLTTTDHVATEIWLNLQDISFSFQSRLHLALFEHPPLNFVEINVADHFKSTITLHSMLYLNMLTLSELDAMSVYKLLEKCLLVCQLSISNINSEDGMLYPAG
ncbi:hypothetical protein RCL1_007025 [Eukaryota sp. TZLM3-RCL]